MSPSMARAENQFGTGADRSPRMIIGRSIWGSSWVARSPEGSWRLTGSAFAWAKRLSPPDSPIGSSCVNRPVCGS